ncbi:MAG: sugar phosphate isomerase/epimerase family protein [Pirellulales bacterium]
MVRALTRRRFVKGVTAGLAGAALVPAASAIGDEPTTTDDDQDARLFKISLAEWSVHNAIFNGELANIDFPKAALSYGIDAVEFVNSCFYGKPAEKEYAHQQLPKDIEAMRQRCTDLGVRPLLIMCDRLGLLGDPDPEARTATIEHTKPWVAAAKQLGCHSLRVNAHSKDVSFDEQIKLSIDGVGRLVRWAAENHELDILLENHNQLTSHAGWLVSVITGVDHPRLGTLADFGNFTYAPGKEYDRYKGMKELMPWARGVSAKSYDFDQEGNETKIDYARMVEIVSGAGYRGYIAVEYEGTRLGEPDGIRATKKLLERVRAELQQKQS